jgi:hemerythrin
MALMVWIPKYSVGVRSIDEQHQRLIALINELHDAMMANRGKDAVGPVLGRLAAYCEEHFSFEEKMLRDASYPGLPEHHQKHVKMTLKVKELAAEVGSGKITVTLEVMTFLRNWLDKHILGTDKEYAPHLAGKGLR